MQSKRRQTNRLRPMDDLSQISLVASDALHGHATSHGKLFEVLCQEKQNLFLGPCHLYEVWDAKKWRAIDHTSQFFGDVWIQIEVCAEHLAAHAVCHQEEW